MKAANMLKGGETIALTIGTTNKITGKIGHVYYHYLRKHTIGFRLYPGLYFGFVNDRWQFKKGGIDHAVTIDYIDFRTRNV